MEKHIFLILGIIGAITLLALLIYWKILDFLNYQKSEIKKLNELNSKLITIVNNHADCLILKVDKEKENISNSALVKILPKIKPIRFNNDELNRDNE